MNVLPIDDGAAADRAAEVVAAGGLIAFPTDTVYGLGCAIDHAPIERLYIAKGRPAEKALPILMGDMDDWREVAATLPETARRLADAFWPGALTILVPRRDDRFAVLDWPSPTVGLRVPDHPALRTVLRATGPLATSSANRSGEPAAASAALASAALGPSVDLLLDGGALQAGPPSTVVDATSDPPAVLRAGAISPDTLRDALA